MIKKRRICLFGILVVTFLSSFILNNSVSAASYTQYQQKALGYGVYRCYTQAQDSNSWTVHSDIVLDSASGGYYNLSSIINSSPKSFAPIYTDNKSLNCRKFMGTLLGGVGLPSDGFGTGETKNIILNSLGYKEVTGDCFTVKSEVVGNGGVVNMESGKICSVDGSASREAISVRSATDDTVVSGGEHTSGYGVNVYLDGDSVVVNIDQPDVNLSDVYLYYPLSYFSDFKALQNTIIDSVKKVFSNSKDIVVDVNLDDYSPYAEGSKRCFRFNNWETSAICIDENNMYANSKVVLQYTLGDNRAAAAYTAINKLLNANFNSKSNFAFSSEQKYALYDYYLNDFYQAKKTCENSVSGDWNFIKQSLSENGGALVSNPTENGPVECYVSPTKHKKEKVNGLNAEMYFDGTQVGLDEIMNDVSHLAKLPDFSMEELEEAMKEVNVDPISPDNSNDNYEATDNCYNSGIDGQAWIICPTISNMREFVVGMDGLINSMLRIDVEDFKADGNTEAVWNTFRTIANVAMIIVLLVIIFSQLTGYGIDNYGIKKMLPKLIMMAVIINLSFIICELAVDLSNIIGVGLQNMLKAIGDAASQNNPDAYDLNNLILGILAYAAGATTAIAGVTIVVSQVAFAGPMVIISLLISLLIMLVSVLMFFIMLGGRLVVVIFFTMISPLAFVCYILPNTQGLFKKWWNIFKTALVVYPICGALYGLSYLIRGTLVGSVNNVPMLLVALVSPFLPFLALPVLLKGAMNTLGVVGGAISSIGNGIRKGLSSSNKALQGTDAYKNQQEQQRRNMTRWRAGVTKGADGKYTSRNVSGIGKFLRGGDSGMASARTQLLRDENAEKREQSLMGAGFDAAVINQEKAASAENIKDYTTLVNDKTNNGADEAVLFKMYDDFVAAGNKEGALAVAQVAGRRKDTAARFIKNKISGRGLSGNALNSFNSLYKNPAAQDIFRSINKEIAEGANSKNFRAAAPTEFEYSSSINQMPKTNANGDVIMPDTYINWSDAANNNIAGAYNVANAINHGITNPSELVGMSAGSLNELSDWVKNTEWVNNISKDQYASYSIEQQKMIDAVRGERNKVIKLASDTIANKDRTGVWDYTNEKVSAIENIAQTQFDIPHGNSSNGGFGFSDGAGI